MNLLLLVLLPGIQMSQDLDEWSSYYAMGLWSQAYSTAELVLEQDSSSADNWAALALASQGLGNSDTADSLARIALSMDSSSALALTAFAGICSDDPQEALTLFRRALDMDPGLMPAMVGEARCLMVMEEYDEALDLIDAAARLGPEWLLVWLQRSEICRVSGDFPKALNTVETALDKWPENRLLLLEKALVLELLEKYDDAEEIYIGLAQQDPEETEALVDLGLLYEHQGMAGQAIKTYRELFQRDPEDYWSQGEMGVCLESVGDTQGAVDSYLEGIRINPDYAFAYYRLALIEEDSNDPDKAMEWYRKCVEADSGFVEAWVSMGLIYEDRGDYQSAETAYRKALDQDPDYAWTWGELGIVLEQLDRPDEAGDAYESGIAVDSGYVWAWEQRGLLYEDDDDLREAARWYRKAIASIDDPGVWMMGELGFVYQRLEEDDSAAVYYRKSIEEDSTYVFGMQRLAPILASDGDYQGALELWDAYLDAGGYQGTALTEEILIYDETGDSSRADSLRGIIAADYPYAWVDLGWTYLMADPDKALQLVKRAEAETDSSSAQMFLLAADLYDSLGYPGDADRSYSAAARISPDSIDVWLGWGYYLFDNDREADAVEKYRAALDLDSTSFDAWSGLGEALLFSGSYDQALDALQRASELSPESPWVYAYLGLAWEQKGDSDRAMDNYFRALSISPGYEYAESRIRGITDTGFDPDWNRRRSRRFTANLHIDLRADNGNVRERNYTGGLDIEYQYDSRGSKASLETDYRFIETSKEYASDYTWTNVKGTLERVLSDDFSLSLSSAWDRQPETVRPWQISSYFSLVYRNWVKDWIWISPSVGLGQVNTHWASGLENERTDRTTVYGSMSVWLNRDDSPWPSLWLWGNFYIPPEDSRHTIMNGLAELTFDMWDPLSLTVGYSVGYTRTPAYDYWDKYDTEFYSRLNLRLF